MTEKKTKVITINDVEYTEDQLTDGQKAMVTARSDYKTRTERDARG